MAREARRLLLEIGKGRENTTGRHKKVKDRGEQAWRPWPSGLRVETLLEVPERPQILASQFAMGTERLLDSPG